MAKPNKKITVLKKIGERKSKFWLIFLYLYKKKADINNEIIDWIIMLLLEKKLKVKNKELGIIRKDFLIGIIVFKTFIVFW